VSEHVDAVVRALKETGKAGEAIAVRRRTDLDRVDALTIPGGESTTISKLLVQLDLFDEIVRRATDEAMPIMGTCAGCILLAKDAGLQADKTRTKLLGLMDMAVDRNAFGRQRESFEADLRVEGLETPFHCVFIRAPAILRTWGECAPKSRYQDRIVLARQKKTITSAPRATAPLRVMYSAGRRTAKVELIVVVRRDADCGPKMRKSGMSAAKAPASAGSKLSIASRTAASAWARIVPVSRTAPTALKPSIVRLTEWLSVVIASDSCTRLAIRARTASRTPGTMLFPSKRT